MVQDIGSGKDYLNRTLFAQELRPTIFDFFNNCWDGCGEGGNPDSLLMGLKRDAATL